MSPVLHEWIPKTQKTACEKACQGVSNPLIKNETKGGKRLVKAAENDPGAASKALDFISFGNEFSWAGKVLAGGCA